MNNKGTIFTLVFLTAVLCCLVNVRCEPKADRYNRALVTLSFKPENEETFQVEIFGMYHTMTDNKTQYSASFKFCYAEGDNGVKLMDTDVWSKDNFANLLFALGNNPDYYEYSCGLLGIDSEQPRGSSYSVVSSICKDGARGKDCKKDVFSFKTEELPGYSLIKSGFPAFWYAIKLSMEKDDQVFILEHDENLEFLNAYEVILGISHSINLPYVGRIRDLDEKRQALFLSQTAVRCSPHPPSEEAPTLVYCQFDMPMYSRIDIDENQNVIIHPEMDILRLRIALTK
jgi:hypothetical protein